MLHKSIESPISAFNNLILQITNKFEQIYLNKNTQNIHFRNQLIFEESSITVFGCIKFVLINGNVETKFCGNFNSNNFELVQKTLNNRVEIYSLVEHYLLIIGNLSNNLDESVSQKFVESLFEQIKSGKISKDEMFLVPYKNKIKHLYDNSKVDKTLENIFNRYSYIIKFSRDNGSTFKYKLCRVLSSLLNESKTLENLRFEEIETINENVMSIGKLQHFLIELFYYGEIVDFNLKPLNV